MVKPDAVINGIGIVKQRDEAKQAIPFEIPVNYYLRSFKEGKKVDVFRDPFTWVRVLFKYRFAKITKDGSKTL